jgi:hypothetical protein
MTRYTWQCHSATSITNIRKVNNLQVKQLGRRQKKRVESKQNAGSEEQVLYSILHTCVCSSASYQHIFSKALKYSCVF